jgi:hypothetical protein
MLALLVYGSSPELARVLDVLPSFRRRQLVPV